jgi:sugar lactone lactonase YvrE
LTDSIFWSDHDQSIYYADFITSGNQSSIFRYDYNTQIVHGAYIEGKSAIAYLVPVKQCGEFDGANNNLYLCGALHDNFLIEWSGNDNSAEVVDTVFSIEADVSSSHMDLGAQNHEGHFVVGTTHNQYCAGPSNSSLYTYSIENGVQNIYTGFQSTAGLTFVGDKIYHNDVCQQSIVELQQDSNGNYQGNVVFDFTTQDPYLRPSGLEADNNGNLYVVGYGNGTVWKINPNESTGEIIATLPSLYLTGVAFGGPQRDILFVVTSSIFLDTVTLQVLDVAPAPPLYMITGLNASGNVSPKLVC